MDLEEAIDIVNRSEFGNPASLFTDSGHRTTRFKHEVEAINLGTAAPMAFFPFDGRKDSFFDDLHAQGEDMINFHTDRTSYVKR